MHASGAGLVFSASSKRLGRRRSRRASARRAGRQRAARSRGEDDRAGRAHGALVGSEQQEARAKTIVQGERTASWSVQGKKGMQGKETVGVLSLRCGQFDSAKCEARLSTCLSV